MYENRREEGQEEIQFRFRSVTILSLLGYRNFSFKLKAGADKLVFRPGVRSVRIVWTAELDRLPAIELFVDKAELLKDRFYADRMLPKLLLEFDSASLELGLSPSHLTESLYGVGR